MTAVAVELGECSQRGNLWRLVIAQALAGANSVVVYATGAIVGETLSPSKLLATLPISIFVVGMALSILPIGMFTQRFGRRATFLLGTGAGVVAGLTAFAAVTVASFWLFCAAMLFAGAYAAVVLSFRFAAADGVSASKRARAMSLVMAGGVAAGVVGPQLVNWTMSLWPQPLYGATFLAQAAVAMLSGAILVGVRLPLPTYAASSGGRPISQIVRHQPFLAAIVCGSISYMLMNFLMTAAPLAMHHEGHPLQSANTGLQWHVVAMYAPSFFTGNLIARFGAKTIAVTGLLLTMMSTCIGLAGVDVLHFYGLLVLLGVGWNFGFLGASALVLECHRPEEKTKVQSLNDFIVFGVMAVGSFSSGGILSVYGWQTVLWVSLIPLFIAAVILVFFLRGDPLQKK
ncbi:MFS transporter [Pseudomonas mosselii]|uniref:MFS transporter n=1 Tax=Pseudomonas mosselii TaxID=78327 RepID=UPI0021A5CABA|nr:MFS transporter [Pseudomonas mosselii]UWS65509.1 MFS transporter [Pseudomonas mosselii]